MSEHAHDQSQLVTHRLTYERYGHERVEDVYVACVSCLDKLGLTCELVFYPADEYEELPAEEVWEVAAWDPDEYPYIADAWPGDVCYRPDDGLPPSMREIWFRRGDAV